MGRGKQCTEEKRNLIKNLRNEGKTYREIKKLMSCSDQMIANALRYTEKVKLEAENVKQRP